MASFGKENSFFYVKKGDMKARKMNIKGGIILRLEEMYRNKYEQLQLWQEKVTPKWYKSDESAWEIGLASEWGRRNALRGSKLRRSGSWQEQQNILKQWQFWVFRPSKTTNITMIIIIIVMWLERKIFLNNKVNRCLARYSPRATTTNQPINRAPNEPARPGPKWTKMPILGQIWSFLGKNS